MTGTSTTVAATVSAGDRATRQFAIDPRIKLAQIVVTGLLVFTPRTEIGNITFAIAIASCLCVLGHPRYAARVLLAFGALSAVYWSITLIPSSGFLAAISMTVFVLRMLVPILGIYYLFTMAMTVSELLQALDTLRVPRVIVIPLAVTLRFFPTIGLEVAAIRDALRVRNRRPSAGGFLRAPLQMLEYVIVPLMMRCITIANELSASAVARGIENPARRTAMRPLRFTQVDAAYSLFVVVALSAPWVAQSLVDQVIG